MIPTMALGILLAGRPTMPLAALDDYMRRCENVGFSGVVLVAKHDTVVFRGAYGFADRDKGKPMKTDSVFDVGSISKQYTATAILHLVDQGKLKLTDPLSTFFPDLPTDKAAITIRQLLNQMSGLDDDYWDEHNELSENDYVAMMLRRPLQFKPGARFQYANFNYHLLKKIIEKVSHTGYEPFIASELFKSAGCKLTGYSVPHWGVGQVVRYEDPTNVSIRFDAPNPLKRPIDLQPEGSGGILSTADDLFRWMVAVRNGRLLSPESTRILFEPVKENYACGWYVDQTNRETKEIYHGGFDTAAGVVSGCYWFPEEDLTIVMLANTSQNRSLRHDLFVPELEDLLLGGQISYPPQAVPTPADHLAACAGEYVLPEGGKVQVRFSGGRLRAVTDVDRAKIAFRFGRSSSEGRQSGNAKLLALAAKADYSSMKQDLSPRIDAGPYIMGFAAHIMQAAHGLGSFQSAADLWQIADSSIGAPETDSFVEMKYAKGSIVLRVIRNADGKIIQIDARNPPPIMSVELCPAGPDKFRTYDFATKSSALVTLTPKELLVADLIAKRQS